MPAFNASPIFLYLFHQLQKLFIRYGRKALRLKCPVRPADHGNFGCTLNIRSFINVKKVVLPQQRIMRDELYFGAFFLNFFLK